MWKRAQSKHMGYALSTALTEYAKSQVGTDAGALEQSYRNSIYCAGVQVQEGGMIRSRYCSNRWCPVCNRIRMGKAINTYLPKVEEWDEPYFVTLTVQNCGAEELPRLVGKMIEAFAAISRKMVRDQGSFVAIRKLECTYGKGYHPHFHIIVESREAAYALRDAWMVYGPKYTQRKVSEQGQDVQKADTESLIELFKYATKLVAKGPDGSKRFISCERLDVIFRALRGRRTYQPYGFKVDTNVEDVTDVESKVEAFKEVQRRILWLWDQEMVDWIDHETGECLTGDFEPQTRGDRDPAPHRPPVTSSSSTRSDDSVWIKSG